MKQITPETKAKIFALYFGQNIFIERTDVEYSMSLFGVDLELGCHVFDNGIKLRAYYPIRESLLLLKPLSSITDEDAIEIAKLSTGDGWVEGYEIVWANKRVVSDSQVDIRIEDNANTKQTVTVFTGNGFVCSRRTEGITYPSYSQSYIIDHLRSKGYALPAYGFSVDELVEAGVFKLKEVNND